VCTDIFYCHFANYWFATASNIIVFFTFIWIVRATSKAIRYDDLMGERRHMHTYCIHQYCTSISAFIVLFSLNWPLQLQLHINQFCISIFCIAILYFIAIWKIYSLLFCRNYSMCRYKLITRNMSSLKFY